MSSLYAKGYNLLYISELTLYYNVKLTSGEW